MSLKILTIILHVPFNSYTCTKAGKIKQIPRKGSNLRLVILNQGKLIAFVITENILLSKLLPIHQLRTQSRTYKPDDI